MGLVQRRVSCPEVLASLSSNTMDLSNNRIGREARYENVLF